MPSTVIAIGIATLASDVAIGYGLSALAATAIGATAYAGSQSIMHGGDFNDFTDNFAKFGIGSGIAQGLNGLSGAEGGIGSMNVADADMAGGLDPTFGSSGAYEAATSGAEMPDLSTMFQGSGALESAPISMESAVDFTPQPLSVGMDASTDMPFQSRDVATVDAMPQTDYNAQADMAGGMAPEYGSSSMYDPAVAGTTMPENLNPTMWDKMGQAYDKYGKYAGGALKIAGGLNDLYQNKQSAKMYQGNMDSINNMYMPGTPEYERLKQEMERNDAAKGRRSQYGTRLADLGAKTAQYRLQALTSPGYQQSMAGANRSNSGAYAGIAAGLGTLFK